MWVRDRAHEASALLKFEHEAVFTVSCVFSKLRPTLAWISADSEEPVGQSFLRFVEFFSAIWTFDLTYPICLLSMLI